MGIFSRYSNSAGSLRNKGDFGTFSVSGNAYGIDLGSNNIKIYNAHNDKIAVHKNMIAIQNKRILFSYGDAAYEMYEKSPSSIKVTYPIIGGVIADIGNMEQLMQCFMKDVQRGGLKAADYFIAVPTDVTEVERRAFYDLIKNAGVKAKHVLGVEKPIADGLGLGIDVKNSQGVMIVDIGYDTTEISVLSLGGIVLSKILKIGGHVFDQSIVNAVRREFNLVIGTKTAESVRLSFHEMGRYDSRMAIYGRDIVTGLPMEKTLTGEFVSKSLSENYRTIVDQVKVMLERTPPELSADIYRHGVFITGGACQEEGLAEQMQDELALDVNMADVPVNTVALGLAQVIKKPGYRSLAYMIEGLGK